MNRVGRGESDNQGWFSYDDGTELARARSAAPATGFAAVAGGDEIHLFGVSQAAARAAGAALRRAGRAVRRSRRGRPTARCSPGRPPTACTWPARCPTCARPVPDCSVIRERRLAAGSDPYWGPADVPGRELRARRCSARSRRRGGRRARSARCGWRGASAAARCGCGCGSAAGRRGSRRGCATAAGAPAACCGAARARGRCACGCRSTAAARRALARRGRLTLRLTVTARAPGRVAGDGAPARACCAPR